MKAVFIPGDGIGVEIARSVLDIVKAMKLDIDFQIYQAGAIDRKAISRWIRTSD